MTRPRSFRDDNSTDGPVDYGTGFDYFVVQVDDLATTVEALAQVGVRPDPVVRHAGPHSSQTTDPDGNRHRVG